MKNKKIIKEKNIRPKKTQKGSRKILSCMTIMLLVSLMLAVPLLWGTQETDALTTKPRVVTRSSVDLAGNVVILKGSLRSMGGARLCLVWFEWGATKNYDHQTRPKIMTDEGIFRLTLLSTAFEPGTLYHYRAVGHNSAGTSYGIDRTFTL